jgi:hypothetical protein
LRIQQVDAPNPRWGPIMPAENTAQEQRKRGRPFQKGMSGNPGGKPTGTRNKATLLLDGISDCSPFWSTNEHRGIGRPPYFLRSILRRPARASLSSYTAGRGFGGDVPVVHGDYGVGLADGRRCADGGDEEGEGDEGEREGERELVVGHGDSPLGRHPGELRDPSP